MAATARPVGPAATARHTHESRETIAQIPRFMGFKKSKTPTCSSSASLISRSHLAPSRATGSSRPVVAMAAGSGKLPLLNDLPLNSYINQQGRIIPSVDPGTVATVFAVLDKNKKVQYVGFSKDIRNTLRTLMGRRPEFCYYYKLYHLPELDQQLMLDIRGNWFSEVGIPPVGNTDPIQRAMWEKPADAGSISERGKAAAAQSKAKTLQQMMVDRGLKEEMIYDAALLEQGKCDVLPSKELSQEEQDASAQYAAEMAESQLSVSQTAPNGDVVDFEIRFDAKIKTNGGWMYDLHILKDDKETRHRVVVGRFYPEAVSMNEDDFLIRTFAFLLHKKLPRHMEGILTSAQFGVNYFAVSEVAQKFDDFQTWFGTELPDAFWRFNRIHSYTANEAPNRSSLAPEAPQIWSPQY